MGKQGEFILDRVTTVGYRRLYTLEYNIIPCSPNGPERRIIEFMKIGVFNCLLRLLITSKIVVGACIWTCIRPQQEIAKGHWKNRCSEFLHCSSCRVHNHKKSRAMFFSSSKNIPRAWFILDQKPKENLILVLTIRLPGEFERWMYKVMSQQMSLSFLSGELCISPDVHPLICICCYLLVCTLSSKSII